jgi:hypothetical protein
MEEMIELVKSGGGSGDTPTKPQSSPAMTPVSTSQVEQTPLSELFKKAEGAWDCSICYVNNKKEAIKCLACETPKPGCEAEVARKKEEESMAAASAMPTFSFGFNFEKAAGSVTKVEGEEVIPESWRDFDKHGFDVLAALYE